MSWAFPGQPSMIGSREAKNCIRSIPLPGRCACCGPRSRRGNRSGNGGSPRGEMPHSILACHVLASQPGESDQRLPRTRIYHCLKACHVYRKERPGVDEVFPLSPAIYELVGAWRAMSHICLCAARRNTPTVLSPWSAMSLTFRHNNQVWPLDALLKWSAMSSSCSDE